MASYVQIAKSEKNRLRAEITRLQEMYDAWDVIERNSKQPELPTEEPVALGVFETQKEAIAAAKDAAFGWQIDAIRDIFRADPMKGFTPGDIWTIVQSKGISNQKAFVYSTLARLVKQGSLVRRERGKYYATAGLISEHPKAEKGSTEAHPLSIQ